MLFYFALFIGVVVGVPSGSRAIYDDPEELYHVSGVYERAYDAPIEEKSVMKSISDNFSALVDRVSNLFENEDESEFEAIKDDLAEFGDINMPESTLDGGMRKLRDIGNSMVNMGQLILHYFDDKEPVNIETENYPTEPYELIHLTPKPATEQPYTNYEQ